MAGETERIILVLPKELLAEVSEHRFVCRSPSRTETLRRLIRSGLNAERSAATASVAARP